MEKIDYKELACKLFCLGALCVSVYFIFKFAFGAVVPFLFAWVIAYFVDPIARELSEKTKISRKSCAFVLMLLFLIIVVCLTFLVVDRVLFEAQNLLGYLTGNADEIARKLQSVFDTFGKLGERLPIISQIQNKEFTDRVLSGIGVLVEGAWKSLLEELGSAVPGFASGLVTALPEALLVLLVSVIACFYFAIDIDIVNSKFKKALPSRISSILLQIKSRASNGLKKYLKAYAIIFVVTFAELLVGFGILGIDYSFMLAFVISLIDFLPVFGTGAILVPWGIILILMKNTFCGIGILVLFAIITVIRQIIEPKILGSSLGVHPLITLVSVYAGYKWFGFFGMVILPIFAVMLLSRDESKNKK